MTARVPAGNGYAAFLTDLTARIQAAPVRAMLAVHRDLVLLYWEIGREILARSSARPAGPHLRIRQFPP